MGSLLEQIEAETARLKDELMREAARRATDPDRPPDQIAFLIRELLILDVLRDAVTGRPRSG